MFALNKSKGGSGAIKTALTVWANRISPVFDAAISLTNYCGPNTFRILASAKIQAASDVTGTVRKAIQAYNEGKLTVIAESNVDGNW